MTVAKVEQHFPEQHGNASSQWAKPLNSIEAFVRDEKNNLLPILLQLSVNHIVELSCSEIHLSIVQKEGIESANISAAVCDAQ